MGIVRFNLKDSSSKEETLIFLIFRYNGLKFKFSTGEKIKPSAWNDKKMIVRSNYMNSADINARLQKIESELNKIYTKYFTEGKIPNNKILKEELTNALNKNIGSEINLMKALDEFIEKSTLTIATIKKYKSLRNHLKTYSSKKRTNVDFHNINSDFYDSFTEYFLEQNYLNNTIGKYISTLKAFLNWAIERKYNKHFEFQKFKNLSEDIDIVYLEDIELNRLLLLDLTSNPTHEKVRDLFCLSCFTGLRYSDVTNLSRENIKDDYIIINTIKTKDPLKIPIINKAKEILNKYIGKNNDQFIKSISNQKMNQYLKSICKDAEIDQIIAITKYSGNKRIDTTDFKYNLITTHTARRTFITLSLEKSIRPEIIMKISGHKDYKTFNKYIKLVDNVVKNELLNKWN